MLSILTVPVWNILQLLSGYPRSLYGHLSVVKSVTTLAAKRDVKEISIVSPCRAQVDSEPNIAEVVTVGCSGVDSRKLGATGGAYTGVRWSVT